jgi:hypothetical protein
VENRGFWRLDSKIASRENQENWNKWTMPRPRFSPRILSPLLIGSVLLPISICVVLAVGAILGGMGDFHGETILRGIAIGGGVLWIINLISLVLVVGLESLFGRDDHDES